MKGKAYLNTQFAPPSPRMSGSAPPFAEEPPALAEGMVGGKDLRAIFTTYDTSLASFWRQWMEYMQREVFRPGRGSAAEVNGGGVVEVPSDLQETIDDIKTGAADLVSRVTDLENKVLILSGTNSVLAGRVVALENILLHVTADRLLGRYATTDGPAQMIKIGPGLDLMGDTLVGTGGGASISGFSSGLSSGFE